MIGIGHCPDPVQVERKLDELGAPRGAAPSPVGEVNEFAARELRLRLLDANGEVLSERTLAVGSSCASRAQASAVVFAAWQTEFTATSIPFPEPPAAQATPPPHVEAQIEAPRQAALLLELRAGLGAGFTADQVEPGLRLEAALLRRRGPRSGPWSAELAVTLGLPREEPLGTGAARWMRSSVALGGAYRWETSSVNIHVEAGAVLTYLTAHGVQLATSRSASAWDGGLRAGLRLVLPVAANPWLLLDFTVWPLARALELSGTPASYELPRTEVGLALGGSFSLALKGSETPAD